ncbi:hypothetical protein ACFY8W_28520 [Streptomyces sp. NPDC012637]|uniref:hypothetical protein n=1 Tax=Streptomyces sp. NPDC012637 TaxID=3364842 RepID=UPI0036EC4F2F
MNLRPAALFVLCLLAVGGCSSAPAHGDADSLPVPLDGVTVVAERQAGALHEAEERSVEACMQRRGFTYEPVPGGRYVSANPYGLLTEDAAGADGYGLASVALAGPAEDPNTAAVARLAEPRRTAWQKALIGTGERQITLTASGAPTLRVNTDGCVYLARRDVYGGAWEQAEVDATGAATEIVAQVVASPEFVAAQKTWAACMAEQGEKVTTLQQARRLIQEAVLRAGGDRSALLRTGRREQQLARRDALCQSRGDLAEATRTAQEHVQARLPESSWTKARRVGELRERALRRTGA